MHMYADKLFFFNRYECYKELLRCATLTSCLISLIHVYELINVFLLNTEIHSQVYGAQQNRLFSSKQRK